jgi:hypothetical protein
MTRNKQRTRYEHAPVAEDEPAKQAAPLREDTPEEGEI